MNSVNTNSTEKSTAESIQQAALRRYFQAGVDAVVGNTAVANSLAKEPLASSAPVYLLAIGKAADAMVLGAQFALAQSPQRGLMVTKHAHSSAATQALPWLDIIEASHPVPDSSSITAGAAVLEFVQTVPAHAQLVVLLSGGASSLVEHLIEGLTLTDLQHVTEQLLAGGFAIDEMNSVRKVVSCIKGGKLAYYLPTVPVTQLVISDVPGDLLSDIGSGLLAPPPAVDNLLPSVSLQPHVQHCIANNSVIAPPLSHNVWQRIHTRLVATSAIAQAAVVKAVAEPIAQSSGSLHGDVEQIADEIAYALLNDVQVGVRVWGGETHLVLPPNPGRGGRNQHLALAVAKRIAGAQHLAVLCCGTDGSDGPTSDAGGIVTGNTVARGKALGLDIDDYLKRADAGSYLAAVGGLITTGVTGTNVMDLAISVQGDLN